MKKISLPTFPDSNPFATIREMGMLFIPNIHHGIPDLEQNSFTFH